MTDYKDSVHHIDQENMEKSIYVIEKDTLFKIAEFRRGSEGGILARIPYFSNSRHGDRVLPDDKQVWVSFVTKHGDEMDFTKLPYIYQVKAGKTVTVKKLRRSWILRRRKVCHNE